MVIWWLLCVVVAVVGASVGRARPRRSPSAATSIRSLCCRLEAASKVLVSRRRAWCTSQRWSIRTPKLAMFRSAASRTIGSTAARSAAAVATFAFARFEASMVAIVL